MKLKGVLDFSLGNFLCLRGFAPVNLFKFAFGDVVPLRVVNGNGFVY